MAHNKLAATNSSGGPNPPGDVHKLFHEAQRRAGLPQPAIKHRKPKSLLLSAPNNIIFELFNTVIKQTPTETLLDFVSKNLKGFLDLSWPSTMTQNAIRRLRREQAIDVRAGLTEAPAIRFGTGVKTAKPITQIVDAKTLALNKAQQQQQQPQHAQPRSPQNQGSPGAAETAPQGSPGSPQQASPPNNSAGKQRSPVIARNHPDRRAAIDRIYEHIMWRIQTDNVTQITSLLIKLVLDDGYKRGKLKAEAYGEIQECFQDWRSQKLIKLYSFGSAPANDQKLILANTNLGDLTSWVANFIDGSEKRTKPEMIRVLATALRDKTKNCIYITHELVDAMNSIETGAIRCAFLVDRLNHYEPITSMPHYSAQIEPLLISEFQDVHTIEVSHNMTVQISSFAIIVLSSLLLVLIIGCGYYLIRNFCWRQWRDRRRTLTDPKRPGPFDSGLDKTTTDEEVTVNSRGMKTHTVDQILRQEERSGSSLHPLKLAHNRQTSSPDDPPTTTLGFQLKELSKSIKIDVNQNLNGRPG